MIRHIVLDSSPLGLLSKPAQTREVIEIMQWAVSCLNAGHKIYIPEIIDYEIRRELLRANKSAGLAKLDSLKSIFRYLPLTTDTMQLAAKLWADSRNSGAPTGDPKKLDIDVILAAQAIVLGISNSDVVIATANIGHLSRFTNANLWTDILA